jgi:hypothetical protein
MNIGLKESAWEVDGGEAGSNGADIRKGEADKDELSACSAPS